MGNNYVNQVGTAIPADPYWANVVLLLNMDGNSGTNAFTDKSSKNKAVTRVGAPTVDGNNGLVLNGSSALTVPASADFIFPGDFCWEFFIAANYGGVKDYLSCGPVSGDGNPTSLWTVLLSGAQLQAYPMNQLWNGGQILSAGLHHIAVYRIGNLVYTAVDGTTGTNTQNTFGGNIGNSAYVVSVGSRNGASGFGNGTVGPVRITKGNSRYPAANFIPPTFGPFPTKGP